MLSVGEIKRSICAHERLAPAESPRRHATSGDWQTKLICPACGAWTILQTPATAELSAVTVERE